ncbi:hypothetical protein SUDANB106_05482 [Streptomyces sp. enrichment culture]
MGDRTLNPQRLARFRDVLTALGARAAVERRIERLSALALHGLHQVCDDPAVHRGLTALVRAAADTEPP